MTFSTLGTMASYVPKQGVTGTVDLSTATVVKGAGMDLITPTSVVGGTLSGGQISFSAVTELSVNGCFTSAYDNYMMFISLDSIATASNYVTWRVRASGTNVSSATYNYQTLTAAGSSAGAGQVLGTTSGQMMYVTLGQSSPARVDCFNPARAMVTQFDSHSNESTSSPGIRRAISVNTNATAYDGFSLLCATAITGILRIYGLRQS